MCGVGVGGKVWRKGNIEGERKKDEKETIDDRRAEEMGAGARV